MISRLAWSTNASSSTARTITQRNPVWKKQTIPNLPLGKQSQKADTLTRFCRWGKGPRKDEANLPVRMGLVTVTWWAEELGGVQRRKGQSGHLEGGVAWLPQLSQASAPLENLAQAPLSSILTHIPDLH